MTSTVTPPGGPKDAKGFDGSLISTTGMAWARIFVMNCSCGGNLVTGPFQDGKKERRKGKKKGKERKKEFGRRRQWCVILCPHVTSRDLRRGQRRIVRAARGWLSGLWAGAVVSLQRR